MGWWPLGSETSLAEHQGGVPPPSQTCTIVFVFSIGQIHTKKKKNNKSGGFPGGPVVRLRASNAGGTGSISGQATGFPMLCGVPKKQRNLCFDQCGCEHECTSAWVPACTHMSTAAKKVKQDPVSTSG